MASYKHSAQRSLRLRLLVLLLVPLLSLAALWAFAAYLTTRDAVAKDQALTTYQKTAVPGFTLTSTLMQERVAAAVLLSTDGRQGSDKIAAARTATDRAQATFRRLALSSDAQQTMSATTKQRLDALVTQLDGLSFIRAQTDAGTLDPLGAINGYDAVIDSIVHLFGSLVLLNDPTVYQQGTAVLSGYSANELMMREDAIVTSALASRRHRLTAPAFTLFSRSVANGRYLFEESLAGLEPSERVPLDRLAASPGYKSLRSLEDSIVADGGRSSLAPKAKRWHAAVTPLAKSWPMAVNDSGNRMTSAAKPIGDRIIYMLYAAAGFGALAVLASIAVSVLFGRSLSRELVGLQRAALDLAEKRLPRLVKRLRDGDKVDVEAEAPPIEVGTRGTSREIANVAEALTTLQRTAVESAVGEAHLRQGINQVFLNLAWRSQSLLHRQLTMLDQMERQASDPDALEGLFALDHLTTRMRRHAEGLVILSGSAPARGWSSPVAVRDILRGAIAEVEDYTRVVVEAAAPAALDGSVVADVTHLLAELIENATAFSPPPTPVNVRGDLTATGYAVEIEDRGVGMNEEELADANHRLAHPPEFDLADSDRLGLFIVGRLAERRGIDVRLQASPYGGARALVIVPLDYIAGDGADFEQSWSDDGPAESRWRPAAWRSNNAPNAAAPRSPAPAPGVLPTRISGAAPSRIQGPPGASRPRPLAPQQGPPPSQRPPRAPNVIASVADTGYTVPDTGHTDEGAPELPRRVRQANIAPQLRRDPPAHRPGWDPVTARPPEETRSLMASLQQGWRRGREEQDTD